MWMKSNRLRILLVALLLLAFYFAVLLRNFNESARRSLELRDETNETSRAVVSVLVTNVNPVTQELRAQLGFRLVGQLARDEVTPAVDLKLLINNFGGQQEFDFPRGRRMNQIVATFPLNGELNRHPLDRYETTVWLLMTTPARPNQAKSTCVPESPEQADAHSPELPVGAATLQGNTSIPLSVTVSASMPGYKFGGQVNRNEGSNITGVGLKLRRADNLIAVSILVMLMMSCLAISVLAMVLRATASGGKYDLVPLSIAISLIFGLPALRSVQPGVPPVGAFGDYVSFIWAELIVAVSAAVTIWTWLLRAEPESERKD
jgi:hypothetical protein